MLCSVILLPLPVRTPTSPSDAMIHMEVSRELDLTHFVLFEDESLKCEVVNIMEN